MPGNVDATNEDWQSQWELHVMAHVYAARAVIPAMRARGEGDIVQTASAAGLLAAIDRKSTRLNSSHRT